MSNCICVMMLDLQYISKTCTIVRYEFDRVSLTIELTYMHMRIHCGLNVYNIEDFCNPTKCLCSWAKHSFFSCFLVGD